jgi:hypothetical protein
MSITGRKTLVSYRTGPGIFAGQASLDYRHNSQVRQMKSARSHQAIWLVWGNGAHKALHSNHFAIYSPHLEPLVNLPIGGISSPICVIDSADSTTYYGHITNLTSGECYDYLRRAEHLK